MNKNCEELGELTLKIKELVKKYCEFKYEERDFHPLEDAVPVSGKVIGFEETMGIVNSALDGWLTTGKYNKLFECNLANFAGLKHALTVNSGSSANLLAVSALSSRSLGDRRLKAGDEIITAAAGFPTTINPILQNKCVPVFVDSDIGTYNANIEDIYKSVTEKTKAIILAHTLGNPFEADKLQNFCKNNKIWFIEDCCDALGAKIGKSFVGTFGDIATLSFYPAHHITMGEGGAVLTNNTKLARIIESFRDWGRACYCPPGVDNTCKLRFGWTKNKIGGNLPDGYDHKYTYNHMGFNLKITDMQAACGLAQLEKLESFISKRNRNYTILRDGLKNLEKYLILPQVKPDHHPSWFGFPLTIREQNSFKRHQLINYLNDLKIGTRLLFSGNVINQPYMEFEKYRIGSQLSNANFIMENTFWIGLYPGLTRKMLNFTVSKIQQFFQ